MTDQKKGPATSPEEEGMWDTESTGGELFKLDKVGDKVEGLIVAKKRGKTSMGEADFYTVQTAKDEKTFIPTAALKQDLEKYLRMYGGLGKTIISAELVDLKKGAYASPFKVFKVRAAAATEARLSALGISTYDSESTTGDDEIDEDDLPR